VNPARDEGRAQVFGAAGICKYSGPQHRGRVLKSSRWERQFRKAAGPPPLSIVAHVSGGKR